MEMVRFRRLTETHGARIAHWPAAERAAARTLLAASAEARAVLSDAQKLDACLSLAAPDVTPERVERVMAAIEQRIDGTGAGRAARTGPAVRGGRRSAPLPPRAVPAWMRAAVPPPVWTAAGFLALMGLFGFAVGDLGVLPLADRPAAASGFTVLASSPSTLIAWDQ